MPFELFDPEGELEVTARDLPHWYQPGVTYFITFRTADSLPRQVLELWLRRRADWLTRRGIDVSQDDWSERLRRLNVAQQREFYSLFSAEFHDHLDAGHGACVLRRPELAKLVASALGHFDGDRYTLGDFVIMPNHVHVLVCLHGTTDLSDLCQSWKRFTAVQINRALRTNGHFWHGESFDHLVRSPEQLAYLARYIAENPVKAHLSAGDFFLFRRFA